MGGRSRRNTRPGFAIRVMWPFAKAVAERQPVALPLFPLSTVLFPGGLLPLKIFEQRYIAMAKACIRDGSAFGVCLITRGEEVASTRGATPEFANVGTCARIVDFDMPQVGILQVATRGEARFQVQGHAVTASRGRMAFYYIARALDLPPGSEVVFPALTFWVVPEMARVAGLKPVFADVDPVTFNLDPAGIKGAKINLTVGFEHTDVRDPLSGETRQISGNHNRWVNFGFRHDIPHSDFAYGVFANHDYFARNYYLSEVNRGWEGPVFAGIYIEDKNVFGLTVRAQAGNLLNARHRFERTVYDGRRLRDPVLYNQSTDQLIGPIFQFLVKGTF